MIIGFDAGRHPGPLHVAQLTGAVLLLPEIVGQRLLQVGAVIADGNAELVDIELDPVDVRRLDVNHGAARIADNGVAGASQLGSQYLIETAETKKHKSPRRFSMKAGNQEVEKN